MTDREKIIQRLDYLDEHPEEETFDSRYGYDGGIETWTNRRELMRELFLENITAQLHRIDDKLTIVEGNSERIARFIKAFDAWKASPSPKAFRTVLATRKAI